MNPYRKKNRKTDFYFNLNNMEQNNIKRKIERILGFKIRRNNNPINNQIEKDDWISDRLGHTEIDFDKRNLVKKIILDELKRNPKDELFWALLGHIYYVEKEFIKGIKCFFKTISINSENIDNWIDLGFAYRAYGDFKTSDFIFWNYEKLSREYPKNKPMNKNILTEIIEKINLNKKWN